MLGSMSAKVPWGKDKPCYVIAELGINHGGSVETAKKLIDAAKEAGADAVKFQKRTVELVYTSEELLRPRESPFGTTNGDLKHALELSYQDYSEIDAYCKEKEITFFASPWDVESVKFLEQFDVPFYKVASACITDHDLLRAICLTRKPVIISTGMSERADIEWALKFAHWAKVAILACTAAYPASVVDLNLKRIHTLMNFYPEIPIGYSGHEVGVWSTLCAVVLGACIVERHLTLDRSMWGSDQAASLEPHAFKLLVREIRDWEKACGSGELGVMECERPQLEKLRRFK
jgi:N-acetylneuraminate synthase